MTLFVDLTGVAITLMVIRMSMSKYFMHCDLISLDLEMVCFSSCRLTSIRGVSCAFLCISFAGILATSSHGGHKLESCEWLGFMLHQVRIGNGATSIL
jgi:hypothetical protein